MSGAAPPVPPLALIMCIGTTLLFTFRQCVVYILTASWKAVNIDKHFHMDFISDPVWACWRKYELWTCSKGFVCFWEQGVPHSSTFFLFVLRRGSVYFSCCLETEQAALCASYQKLGEHPVGIQQYDLRGAATVTTCVWVDSVTQRGGETGKRSVARCPYTDLER
jgi:hypothetical protein